MKTPISFSLLLLVAILLVLTTVPQFARGQSNVEFVITRGVIVDIAPPWDTIDSGVAECMDDAIKYAEANNALLIYRVNSYGGQLDSAFSIGDAVYYSRIPSVAYVENKALSAGTLILLPANYIALQKGSIIGAMTPVILNPVTGEVTFVNESKIIEPILGKVRVYTNATGRNTTLAIDFVLKAKVVDSSEAVKYNIANAEVSGFNELLDKIRGLVVEKNGIKYRLEVTHVEPFTCSIRSRMISIFSNPYLANILLSIGVLTAIFALIAGKLAVLPIAVMLILLGLMSTGLSPNSIAVFFIILGAILLAVELFVLPGFGIVGISGITLLVLGFSLLPVYVPAGVSPTEEYIMALRAFIFGTAIVLGGFFGIVIFKVVQVRRKKPISYTPVGKTGIAQDEISPGSIGFVKIEGEYWRATSRSYIRPGDEVVVLEIREDGVLVVDKKREKEESMGI